MNKYQESLDELKHCEIYCGLEVGSRRYIKNKYSNNLQELVDKEEYYRWHDLKKDPKDLPKNDSRVLVELGKVCRSGIFIDGFFLDNFQAGKDVDAIAWKYLERFEEK